MSGRSGSLAAARYRLGREGYVLSFELVGGELWCRSCDVSLVPERCTVESSVVVGRSEGGAARLLAIRSDSPALRGTWLVGVSAGELRFMHDLVRRGRAWAALRDRAQVAVPEAVTPEKAVASPHARARGGRGRHPTRAATGTR